MDDMPVTHGLHGRNRDRCRLSNRNRNLSNRTTRKHRRSNPHNPDRDITAGCRTCLQPTTGDIRGRTDPDHQHGNIWGGHPLHNGRKHTDGSVWDSLFRGSRRGEDRDRNGDCV